MKVNLAIRLEIDASSEEELEEIIQEMSYDFTYTEWETDGEDQWQKELIKKTEIIDYEIVK